MGIFSSIGSVVGSIFGGPQLGGSIGGSLGGLIDGDANKAKDHAMNMAVADANLQREFAQNSIRWKVADAKAAGLHPLAALGAQTFNASPVFAGVQDNRGAELTGMSQNISRAIDATRTAPERVNAYAQELSLERMRLENKLLEGQILNVNRASNPPLPGSVDLNPNQLVIGDRGNSSRAPGRTTTHEIDADNGLVMSSDYKQRVEDDFIAESLWHLKNRFVAPRHPDQDMFWNPVFQKYQRNPVPRKYRFIN